MELLEALELRPGWVRELFYGTPEGLDITRCHRRRAGFLYGLFIITKVLVLGVDVPGYASLMTAVLFFGGVQLLSLGVIGEYLGRLFTEVKRRPIYLVENVYENLSGHSGRPREVDN